MRHQPYQGVWIGLGSGLVLWNAGCSLQPERLSETARELQPLLQETAREAGESGGAAFADSFADRITPRLEQLDEAVGKLASEALAEAKPELVDVGQATGESFGNSFGESFGETVSAKLATQIDSAADRFANALGEQLDRRVVAISGEIGESAETFFDRLIAKYFARADESDAQRTLDARLEVITAKLSELSAKSERAEKEPDRLLSILGLVVAAVAAAAAFFAIINSVGRKEPKGDLAEAIRPLADRQDQMFQALLASQRELAEALRKGQQDPMLASAVQEVKAVVSNQRDMVAAMVDAVRNMDSRTGAPHNGTN